MAKEKSVEIIQMISKTFIRFENKGVEVTIDENEMRDLAKAVFQFCLMSEETLREDVQEWLKSEKAVF
jgi:ribosome maturation protein Sdo1